ncbi:class I SAM-dependent methyltransferase [Acidaminobacter sp. JC074]|uniref:class I SAM-dependent DNA methyltransferase n=1 Tax=Acidaminobacter sp. JC074 TaxID=2530199 RepID=UPI001F114DA7|nr:class I SAM-dependent methyltransferase [Acidaminobacter sp. JC074]MCH4889506.1 class I SAM-dependent methyltransferase [Acidaminobacter sp. JC074]
MIYQGFARVYDQLMKDTPYDTWFENLQKIIKSYDIKGKEVLELACGTGAMTRKLYKAGYKVLGTDLSQEMLEIALETSYDQNLKIQFIQQDMTSLDLFHKYDMIVSFCDGFNYLIEDGQLDKALDSCRAYIKDQGYLIFDISSDYKLEHVLGQNVFTETSDEACYIWENYYDEKSKILEFDLTLFEKQGNMYQRHDEVHKQRAYTIDEIQTSMAKNGFECLEVIDTNTGEKVTPESERWLFIGRKINE